MLFNSTAFALFFPTTFVLYWMIHRRYRAQNGLLLVASLIFYGSWDHRFLYLFLLTTIVDFVCALMIGRGRVLPMQRVVASLLIVLSAFLCVTVRWPAIHVSGLVLHTQIAIDWRELLPRDFAGWAVLTATGAVTLLANLVYPFAVRLPELTRRRVFMWASAISNLGVLGFFKYFNFFADTFTSLCSHIFHATPGGWTLHVILPVGISFYTFQSLAYTIDVYRGHVAPVESYLTLSTFLSFFPQLVAGPIERAAQMLPQFTRPRSLNTEQFRDGVWLITWGLFKKVVVADQVAVVANSVFTPFDGLNPSQVIPHDGLRMLIGIYAFAVQIYGDFSGYTDMARGVARLLGFDLMLNFKLPYFAVSPSDFWRRWHISLSTWLRDYLYIPLGGNRGGALLTYRNLFITMLLGGLWHGARWTFVLWGAFHGVTLIAYRLIAPDLGEARVRARAPDVATPLRAPVSVAAYSMLIPVPAVGRYPPASIGRAAKHVLLVFLMFQLTCLGWLLFRAQSLEAICVFLESIFLHPHWSSAAAAALHDLVFYSWFLIAFQCMQGAMGTLDVMKRLHWFWRLNIWVIVIMSLLALSPGKANSFIYFAF